MVRAFSKIQSLQSDKIFDRKPYPLTHLNVRLSIKIGQKAKPLRLRTIKYKISYDEMSEGVLTNLAKIYSLSSKF